MADSSVAITAGSGTAIDTRTESTNGQHRQVVVLGDPTTNAGVAPVDATKGLGVDLSNTGANTTALKVDGSAVTQPVSGTVTANLGTIAGVSTAAKQPALGTAGTASSDVLTVQGITSMTPLKVDNSGVTQPVSGTVTANAGTNLNTSALALDATLTGGTQKSKIVDSGGTNVATVSAGGALKTDSSATTQPVSMATAPVLVAGSAIIGKVGIDQTTPGTTNGVQVNAALPAGSAIIGKVTTDQTTHGTSDLVAADITKYGGTAVGITNPQAVYNGSPASSTATWTTATSINTALTNSSALGYGTATVTTIETGTTTTAGALTFEVYDGTNWWAINGQQTGSYTIQSAYTLVNGTNVAWTFNIAGFQGFRVRLSTAITGTGSPQVVVIMQLQATATVNTPAVGLSQKLDQVNDAITAYPFGNSFFNITTNATTTVKSGAGVFKGFTVNNNGFTTAGTITIYDNTAGSGTKIGTYTLPLEPPGTVALATVFFPPQIGLDLAFSTGLTFVTATTAPAADITVIYR